MLAYTRLTSPLTAETVAGVLRFLEAYESLLHNGAPRIEEKAKFILIRYKKISGSEGQNLNKNEIVCLGLPSVRWLRSTFTGGSTVGSRPAEKQLACVISSQLVGDETNCKANVAISDVFKGVQQAEQDSAWRNNHRDPS
ncbi:hypothetical protein SprV_0401513300 [Sparganum proliferum]